MWALVRSGVCVFTCDHTHVGLCVSTYMCMFTAGYRLKIKANSTQRPMKRQTEACVFVFSCPRVTMCTHLRVCAHMHVYPCPEDCVAVCVCPFVHVHPCSHAMGVCKMCPCACVSVPICLCVHLCVCVYVCVCMCTRVIQGHGAEPHSPETHSQSAGSRHRKLCSCPASQQTIWRCTEHPGKPGLPGPSCPPPASSGPRIAASLQNLFALDWLSTKT